MIAFRHMPCDDLGFLQAFAKVRQDEDICGLGWHALLPSAVPQGSARGGEDAVDAG